METEFDETSVQLTNVSLSTDFCSGITPQKINYYYL